MSSDSARRDDIRAVLSGVASLSRMLSSAQKRPFEGRILSGSQLSVLFHLAHGSVDVTPGRLAKLLGVTPGAITQLIGGLQTEGHVDIRVGPDDARSRIVVLSAAARKEVEDFEAATAKRLEPHFASLTAQELATLAQLMGRIRPVGTA
ncbi:MAG: winged helix-turn-helix transcriptional regulator [Micrococcales bacterium]|nr:winged helix-turn-helix transcriptional regulator [Micrococcales bacterium]